MPRGRPRKYVKQDEIKTDVSGNGVQEETAREEVMVSVTPNPQYEPLGPGQKYFESPTGVVVIGDAEKDHLLWYDPKQGKRVLINPKR